MYKVNFEQYPNRGYKIEKMPTREDKTVDIFCYDDFTFLNIASEMTNSLALLSVKLEGTEEVFLWVKPKIGNGFVNKTLESGQRRVTARFDIVSPIYYCKNPTRMNSGAADVVTFQTNTDSNFLFFPTLTTTYDIAINDFYFLAEWSPEAFGDLAGVAGYDFFRKWGSYALDTSMGGLEKVKMELKSTNTKPFIFGKYEVL